MSKNEKEVEQVLLSADEPKNYLGIGRSTAYRLLNQEDFPTMKIGRRTLAKKKGVDRWIEKHVETNILLKISVRYDIMSVDTCE